MGFVIRHKVGTGMHVTGPDIKLDLVVMGFDRSANTADIDVRRGTDISTVVLSYPRDMEFDEGFRIGLCGGSHHQRNVRIFYHGSEEIRFAYREYT